MSGVPHPQSKQREGNIATPIIDIVIEECHHKLSVNVVRITVKSSFAAVSSFCCATSVVSFIVVRLYNINRGWNRLHVASSWWNRLNWLGMAEFTSVEPCWMQLALDCVVSVKVCKKLIRTNKTKNWNSESMKQVSNPQNRKHEQSETWWADKCSFH